MKPLDTAELKAVVEGLLLVADGSVRPDRIALTLEIEEPQALAVLQELQAEYDRDGRGFFLQSVDGGFQLRTRQPVTRAEINYLRGVDSGGVIRTLLDKRLIRILGKKDIPGKPLIYGTSREFLELFGLQGLADLPTLKEFNDLPPDMLAAMDGSSAEQASPEDSSPS